MCNYWISISKNGRKQWGHIESDTQSTYVFISVTYEIYEVK